jgi:hypothetical protein
MWSIAKTYLLHQLNLPYEEDPYVLLDTLLVQAPALLESRPGNLGVFSAMVFMLQVNKLFFLSRFVDFVFR